MEYDDSYRTISKESRGLYKEKGSRFISVALPVRNESEIKHALEEIKKEFHDARHHSYAYALGKDGEIWRANDDGEPSGTAGKPILGQIRSFRLTHVLVVVPRYFGGTLLGTGGLIIAYKTAAEDALKSARTIDHIIKRKYELIFPWGMLNEVMKLLKEESAEQLKHSVDLECRLETLVRLSMTARFEKKLSKIKDLCFKAGEEE